MFPIGLVADDLTGACDCAALFAGAGTVRVGVWPRPPGAGGGCRAISTESRESPAEVAYERSLQATRSLLAAPFLFRKLDSRLRGRPRSDLAGALDATGAPRCVVAPALPAETRTTAGRVQHWPGGEFDLARLEAGMAGRVVIADAGTDADLDRIATAILASGDRVAAGSHGLAAALARALGVAAPAPSSVGSRRPLAIVGSPAAARQAAAAAAAGWRVIRAWPSTPHPIEVEFDALFLSGGATAARVLQGLGCQEVEVLGEAVPRAPLCRLIGGRHAGLPVVLRSGGFGGPSAICEAMEVLTHGG